MRSFGECSFLEDSRYASQIIFVARTPAFVSRAQRSASATGGAITDALVELIETRAADDRADR
jgi:hypothetical protein